MFWLPLTLPILRLARAIVAPSAGTCLEEPLQMTPGAVTSEQEVDDDEVALVQVGLTQTMQEQVALEANMQVASSQANRFVAKYSQFVAQYTQSNGSRGATPPQAAQTASFTSADGRLCLEGTLRAAESALAMKKANPVGRLYDNVYAAMGTTCAQRGYMTTSGADQCQPNVNLYFKTPEDLTAFGKAEAAEMVSYGQRFGHNIDTVRLMSDCTCHTSSALVAARGSQCDALNSQPGAWVHHDPDTEEELMCDEGPFVLATLAMAILKSTRQLPMHIHDTVSATSCASLGFPVVFPPEDHCFPPMRIWTRTNISTDAGVDRAQAVEGKLFGTRGFEEYFLSRGLSLNFDDLTSVPGCHCLPNSAVYQNVGKSVPCSVQKMHPPICDWWTASWTSAWPPSP